MLKAKVTVSVEINRMGGGAATHAQRTSAEVLVGDDRLCVQEVETLAATATRDVAAMIAIPHPDRRMEIRAIADRAGE